MMGKYYDQDLLERYVVSEFDNLQVDSLKKCYDIENGEEYILNTHEILPKLAKSIKVEVNSLCQLDHPSILRLHEVYEGRTTISLVYQGFNKNVKTLLEHLQDEASSCLKEENASIIIFRIVSSIMYYYSKNIAHLNLRLENIFLLKTNNFNDIKITNFGSSNSYTNSKNYDLFSIGIITFGLVTGIILSPPNNIDGISTSFVLNNECFQNLSCFCKDFILTCLEAPKNTNIDAGVLRNHSWLRNSNHQNEKVLSSTYFSFVAFKKMPLLSRVFRYILSHSITDNQCINSRFEFMKFDKEGLGEISLDIFTETLQRSCSIDSVEIRDLFNAINITQSSYLRYSEIIAAMLQMDDVTNKNVEQAYLRLSHGYEHFTMDDLQLALGESLTREYFEDMFNEVGFRPFSVISLSQFKELLFSKSRKLIEYNNMCEKKRTQYEKYHNIDTSSSNKMKTVDSALPENSSKLSAYNHSISQERQITEEDEEIKKDIFDVYSVDKEAILGAGANGSVVKCCHRLSGIQYALKTLSKSKYTKRDKSDAWKQEIQIMKKLDHPNILRFFEYFETSTKIYLILELCTGGDLLDKLNNLPNRCFSEIVACKYVRDILRAIRYCHDQGIVHRDLKLDNILIEESSSSSTSTSEMKLIDFGLACYFNKNNSGSASSGSSLDEPVGTPYYVAPEVIAKCYNEKCDIWSLGVITYMFLTGNPPFNGDNETEILKQVKRKELKLRRSDFNHTISDAAISFMRFCLTKDSSERISAEEAQKHPWFAILTPQDQDHQQPHQQQQQDLSPQIMKSLKEFPRKDPLVRIFLEALSHTLPVEDQVEVRKAYFKIDVSGAGEINYGDWLLAMEMSVGFGTKSSPQGLMTEREAATVFSQLDATRIGKIRYHQFLAATLSPNELKEAQLKLAFDRVARHNQYITANDLKVALLGSHAISKQEAETLLDDIHLSTFRLNYSNFLEIVSERCTYSEWKSQQEQHRQHLQRQLQLPIHNQLTRGGKSRDVSSYHSHFSLSITSSFSTSSLSHSSSSPVSIAYRKNISMPTLDGNGNGSVSVNDSASVSPDNRRLPPILFPSPSPLKSRQEEKQVVRGTSAAPTTNPTPLSTFREISSISLSLSPPSPSPSHSTVTTSTTTLLSRSSHSTYSLIPKSFGLRQRTTTATTHVQQQQQQQQQPVSLLTKALSTSHPTSRHDSDTPAPAPSRLAMPSLGRFYQRHPTPLSQPLQQP